MHADDSSQGVEIHFHVSLLPTGALNFSYFLDNGQVKRHWTTLSVSRMERGIQAEISGSLMQSLVAVGNLLHSNSVPVDHSSFGQLKSTDRSTSLPSET